MISIATVIQRKIAKNTTEEERESVLNNYVCSKLWVKNALENHVPPPNRLEKWEAFRQLGHQLFYIAFPGEWHPKFGPTANKQNISRHFSNATKATSASTKQITTKQ